MGSIYEDFALTLTSDLIIHFKIRHKKYTGNCDGLGKYCKRKKNMVQARILPRHLTPETQFRVNQAPSVQGSTGTD